jgi:hypothetical protein
VRSMVKALCVLVAFSVGSASAQDTAEGGGGSTSTITSVMSAKTVGSGNNVVHAEIGYPQVSGTFLHGVSDGFDIGGKVGLGFPFYSVGLNLQAVGRFHLTDINDKISLGLRFLPGITLNFGGLFGSFFVSVPLQAGFVVGIHPIEKLNIGAGIDVIPTLNFGQGFFFSLPIIFGAGAEYWITPTIAVTADFRVGPTLGAVGGLGGLGGFGYGYFYGQFLVGGAFKL